MKRLFLTLGALGVLACSKNIQNADAVRQGVLQHLRSRPDMGLNLDAMEIQVSNVSFREKEADANVAFVPKGRPANSGMSMAYKLVQEGDKWVVKSKAMASMGGAPVEGGAAPELPAGHAAVPAPKGN